MGYVWIEYREDRGQPVVYHDGEEIDAAKLDRRGMDLYHVDDDGTETLLGTMVSGPVPVASPPTEEEEGKPHRRSYPHLRSYHVKMVDNSGVTYSKCIRAESQCRVPKVVKHIYGDGIRIVAVERVKEGEI